MSETVTILHLVSAGGDWETSVHVASLAAALREHGINSLITAPDHSRLWELAEAAGVEAVDLALESSINPLRWLETGKIVKELGAQIFHVHDAEAAKVLGRAGMFSTLGKVVVGRQNLYTPPNGNEYGSGIASVICPSAALAGVYRSLKAPEERIHVIPDGVSLAAADRAGHERDGLRVSFRDAYCPAKEKPLFLVNIAPLESVSGQEGIVEAMENVAAVLPQSHLFIMGEGSALPELQRRIKIAALEKYVTLLEPDKAFHRLLAAADLYVSNSCNDVSGYMVQAAMAAGRAAVLTRAGCYEEIVEDGKTAVFARGADVEDLKSAMLELLQSRSRREHIGRMARSRAAREFDIAVQAGKVAEVYRGLL